MTTALGKVETAVAEVQQLNEIAVSKLEFTYTADQQSMLSPEEKANYTLKKQAENALSQLRAATQVKNPLELVEELQKLIKSCVPTCDVAPSKSTGWFRGVSYSYQHIITALNQKIQDLAGDIKNHLSRQ